MKRRGSVAVGLIFVGLIVAAVTVVMAISNQSQGARATAIGYLHGRYAVELAESCIAEAMADFDLSVQKSTGGRDLRTGILNAGQSGPVAGRDVIGVETLTTDPVRTRALSTFGEGFQLSPVTLRFLDFHTHGFDGKPINKGRVEFVATVTSAERGGRVLSRTVTWRHNIALRSNGNSFRLEQVPFQVFVDRRGGP